MNPSIHRVISSIRWFLSSSCHKYILMLYGTSEKNPFCRAHVLFQDTHLMYTFLIFLLSRDESEAYLAGLGTVAMEIYEQVPKLDAVVVPAAGQYGLLAGTAAAIKHLNSQILVIVSATVCIH